MYNQIFNSGINVSIKHTFIIAILLLVNGVFGDDEKVSVYEGESVTLHTNMTLNHKDDKVLWGFRTKDVFFILLAQMIEYKVTYVAVTDKRFKDRMLISDTETGDLTIKDIRIKHSGIYDAEIRTDTGIVQKTFNVTVKETPQKPETFKDKSVSVTGGASVTLNTNIEIKEDDLIIWRFGDDSDLIAKYDVENNKISYYDERFRDRIKLNNQTGDLIINDVTTTHAGLYKLHIYRITQPIEKLFIVSVSGAGMTGVIAGLCVFFILVIVSVVTAGWIWHRGKITKLRSQKINEKSESVALQSDNVRLPSGDVMKSNIDDEETVE